MADTTRTQQMAQYFWNAYSNIQAQVGPEGGYDFNREQLTYIQADERYVSYMEQYADMQNINGTERTQLIDRARETHRASVETLDTSPGYSTDMQGLANDFYFVIEQSYPQPAQTTQTVQADPITSRIDAAFAATEGATVEIPGLAAYAATLREEPRTPAVETPAVTASEPVVAITTPMGDVAMTAPASEVSTLSERPTTPAVETPTPAESEPVIAVTTPMGDVAMTAPASEAAIVLPTVEVTASANTPAYDESFTRDQLGALGQAPAAGITQDPVTKPIAVADMPIPQPNEPVQEQPAETPTPANTAYTVRRGDSLEAIARSHYGIERGNFESRAAYQAAIQNAASHIASATGLVTHPNGKNYDLTQGANANHVFPGQTLQLPPAEALSSAPASRLNYANLDAGGPIAYSRSIITTGFRAAAEGTNVATATTPALETPAVSQELAGVADRRVAATAGVSLG